MEESSTESNLTLEHNPILFKRFGLYILAFFLLFFLVYFFLLSAPANFSPGTIIKIEQGMGLRSVSFKLKENNIIRSRIVFEAFVILLGGEKSIKYSDYLFEDKLPVYKVAGRIIRGEHQMELTAVTIPEGFNVFQIADTFSSQLINFDKNKFFLQAEAKEGYLFPDTYYFFNEDNEHDVFLLMTGNFEKKISPLRTSITLSGKTEKEIIIMASLIEGEAKGDDDRAFISGVLWKRLDMNMPLQVDVAPETYNGRGLPKNPVGNPGLEAIKAAINPTKSSYLYYLHDKNGNIHYAKTFEEHRQNILKYLK